MTDQELLELAAHAADIGPWEWNGVSQCIKVITSYGWYKKWLPLDNDGEALRLAVKLGMRLEIADYYAIAQIPGVGVSCRENTAMGYGIGEATRRAIVRAAAEIGRKLQTERAKHEPA